jgi:hypothetical protein
MHLYQDLVTNLDIATISAVDNLDDMNCHHYVLHAATRNSYTYWYVYLHEEE